MNHLSRVAGALTDLRPPLLAAVLPSAKAMSAVGLGIALPLSFFSDVFAIGFVPEWMSTVGSFFP